MSNQATQSDTGFRDHRVEFVREDSPGVAPSNPEWNLFSDTLETGLQWDADAMIEEQRGLGDHRVQNHFTGAEDHQVSIDYHLQQFFVDADGEPLDPSGDAILRDAEGGVRNTHTIVDRAEYDGARTYVVARGCHPNLGDVSGDPGTALPMVVQYEAEAKSVRMFKVEQPDGEVLTVRTDGDDSGQTLTLESDGAVTTEEVTIGAETTTTGEFDSLDALALDEPADGDVIIEDSAGNELARINGADSYGDAEGDRGVPALGSGSHADTIGTEYERFLDDYIERDGRPLAAEVRSAAFNVDNNYDKEPIMGTTEQAIHIGEFGGEFTATVAGNFESYENINDHLTGAEFDLHWEMSGGQVVFEGAVIEEPGTVGPSADDIVSTIDATFSPKNISLD